jgi:hypothetical protein
MPNVYRRTNLTTRLLSLYNDRPTVHNFVLVVEKINDRQDMCKIIRIRKCECSTLEESSPSVNDK